MVETQTSNPSRFTPMLAAVLLLLLLLMGVQSDEDGDGNSSAAIQDSLDSIPRQLQSPGGTWIFRREVPVPSSQAVLLGLTSAASSEYQRAGTYPPVLATLFIAYCDEIRSMAGHHPPNCYPASGWQMAESGGAGFEVLNPGERTIKARLYEFSRGFADNPSLWIVNGFFDGKGSFVDRLEEAESLAAESGFSGQGMFQFQILFQGDFGETDIQRYAEEILWGIPESVLVGREVEEPARRERSRGAV